MVRGLVLACFLCVANSSFAADQPEVRVEPSHLQGLRPLEKQTESAVIRDYLEAWRTLRKALAENRSDLLDADFVGDARDKLGATISDQGKLSIHTNYHDRAHDLQVLFYSPDGLSIQLVDNVDYDVQIIDHDKVRPTQKLTAKYIAVLTPSEVRWRVRILQSQSK